MDPFLKPSLVPLRKLLLYIGRYNKFRMKNAVIEARSNLRCEISLVTILSLKFISRCPPPATVPIRGWCGLPISPLRLARPPGYSALCPQPRGRDKRAARHPRADRLPTPTTRRVDGSSSKGFSRVSPEASKRTVNSQDACSLFHSFPCVMGCRLGGIS